MIPFHTRLFGAVVALSLAAGAPALSQQLELKIMAPAAPGGGWDQTARSMQQALVAAKIARSVQVTNVAGAGGSVGIAQFVTGAKGDGNQMMVNGFVMVGALAMNKSPVTLDQVTPIARLTEEIQVIVVPANSPIKTAQDLAAAVKADIAKVTFAGGSAGGVDHVMAALFAGAIGVTWSSVTGDRFIASAPTMTKPFTISWLPSPLAPLTNCAMPTLPPAPATLVTWTLRAILAATRACCIALAV